MTVRKGKATEWTMSSLSVEMKMDKRRVAKLIDGLKPHRTQGNRDYYYFRDVVDHIMANGDALDPSQESAKLNQARREKVEMETRIMRGDLCETEAVRGLWTEVVTNAKAKLLAMPHKIAPQVVGMEYSDALSLMNEAVRESLAELESTDGAPESISLGDEEEGGDD